MSGAPATSPKPLGFDRWSFCLLGPPECPVHTGHVLFNVRCASARVSDFCALWRAFNAAAGDRWCELAVALLVHRTVRCTPDSPVNYSGAISRGWRVPEALFLGAPDTVRCTPDSPVNYRGVPLKFPKVASLSWSPLVHRTLSGGAPDSPVPQTRDAFGCPFAPLLNPILGHFIG
jgi:hypothetical protein